MVKCKEKTQKWKHASGELYKLKRSEVLDTWHFLKSFLIGKPRKDISRRKDKRIMGNLVSIWESKLDPYLTKHHQTN